MKLDGNDAVSPVRERADASGGESIVKACSE